MESKWLEDYLALVKNGSFTKAAEARHVTQPAFSRRIRALENWLGADLVDRNTYPTTLTPTGEALIDNIQFLIDKVRQLQRCARDQQRHLGSLIVATQHSLSISVCPVWYERIRSSLPAGTSLRVNAGNMHDCIEQFVAGNADILICYHTGLTDTLLATEGLNFAPLGMDELVPVAAVSHRSAFMAPGDKPLPDIPLVAFPTDSFFGQILAPEINAMQRGSVFRLRPVYVTAQSESAHAMARQGMGMTWLPRSLVARDLDKGRLFTLPFKALPIEIRLYWRDSDTNPHIADITQQSSSLGKLI